MKEYLLRTKQNPCAVKFNITGMGQDVPLYLQGYDPLIPFSYYFNSKFLISGREEIVMNCPLSPSFLKINVFSDDDALIDVTGVTKLPFDRPSDVPDWMGFIETFSRNFGTYTPITPLYYRPGVPFQIEMVRKIYREDGKEHATPARIAVELPIIQVSYNKFRDISIPGRVAILCHEVAHNFINNDGDNEQEADDNGLRVYTYLGYPKIEAINSFAEIMNDSDVNVQRMSNLITI